MRYRWISSPKRTLTVDALDGGLQLHRAPEALPAGALSRCTNLLWKGGALAARAGWRCTDAVCAEEGALLVAPDTHHRDGLLGRRILERLDGQNRIGTVWQDGTVHTEETDLDTDTVHLLCDIGGGRALVLAGDRALIHTDGAGTEQAPVYIPTVRMGGRGSAQLDAEPAEPGVFFEEFNLLTPAWKETFTTDGVARCFYLVRRGLEAAVQLEWTNADGLTFTHSLEMGQTTETRERGDGLRLVYHKEIGAVALMGYPNLETVPSAAGFSGNMTVTVMPQGGADARILGMRRAVWYGGQASGINGGTRLFFSGNPDHPELVHWSAVNRPDYLPENNYLYVGSGGPVTAMARQSDRLILFKEREIYALQYAQGEVSAQSVLEGTAGGVQAQSAYFTLQPIHSGIGTASPESVVLCGGRLVFLSADGQVCRLSGLSALSEGNVRILSEAVAPLLEQTDTETRRCACAGEWAGNYLLCIGDQLLVLCGGDDNFSLLSSGRQGAWYRWQVPFGVSPAAMLGAVCIGTAGRYLRAVHALGGDTDDAVQPNGSIRAMPVQYELQTGLLPLGSAHRFGCAEQVWLQLGAGMPVTGCRTEWGALAATGEGGRICPQRCKARYLAVSARGQAPFAAYGLTIRYTQMGTVK